MRRTLTAVVTVALAVACATPGLPPGGPTVSSFPRVIASLPDTNTLNARPGKVLIRYDDVIGEQANGGPLSRVVLISPRDGEPRVEWRRTGLAIRPKGDWMPNTAYTITVLPGIGDLSNKASPYGYVLRFTTGGAIPKSFLSGIAFDWSANRPLARATVSATSTRDTTVVHISVADSLGRFTIGAVPAGSYLIRAFGETTPNRVIDGREPWDSARVTLVDSSAVELYAFVHDTLPPRIAEVRQTDSVTISVMMDKPLLPGVAFAATIARVLLADSSVVPVTAVLTQEEDRVLRTRADSIARSKDTTVMRAPDVAAALRRSIDPTRRRDTVITDPSPIPKRTQPTVDLVIRLGVPLKPASTYRVSIDGARNLMGVAGPSTRLLIIPKATPPDSSRGEAPARDTTGARRPAQPARDTTAVRRPAPPPRPPRQ